MTPAERIVAYFSACNSGDASSVASHFTEHAVVYDTNVRPARGASEIGATWAAVGRRWGAAQWSVDSVVSSADGGNAAIEWSMAGTDPRTVGLLVFRGSEHYRLVDGLIDEIRQYWTSIATVSTRA